MAMSTQPSAASVEPPTESPPVPKSEPVELPLDVVFDLLSNERRRRAIRYLLDESETITLGDLSEYIASIENDKPVRELSSTERKRVYICFYQCHLPRMDDADVIDFDNNRKTIEVGEKMEQVTRFLPEQEDAVAAEKSVGWTTSFAELAQTLDRRLRTLMTTRT